MLTALKCHLSNNQVNIQLAITMLRVHNNNHWLPMSVDGVDRVTELEDTTLDSTQDEPSSASFSPLPSSSPCILAECPIEILIKILDYLPNSSVLSLAATRKDLYEAVKLFSRGRMLALKRRDIAEFTKTLQRDFPNSYCCAACHKLCPLNPDGAWRDQNHPNCSGASQ